MYFSLTQAAEATGKGRMTIQRAIKNGRISANKNDAGAYEIDPAELHRVFPPSSREPSQETRKGQDVTLDDLKRLRFELAAKNEQLSHFDAERRRERDQLESVIEDLRKRLDRETDERQHLTLALTDQREERASQQSFLSLWKRG